MAGNTSAIKAGSAFVQLFADDSLLIKGLNEAKARVGAFQQAVGKPALLAGGAVLAPVAKLLADAVRSGNDLAVLAQRYGTSAEKIYDLKNAFAAAGADGDEFAGVLDTLAAKITAAADSREELFKNASGLRGDQLLGMGFDKQLDAIFEKMKQVHDNKNFLDFSQMAKEMGMEKLAPYLAKGKAGLDELRRMGRANNGAFDPEAVEKSRAAMVAWTQATEQMKSVLVEVGKTFLPTTDRIKEYGATIRKVLADVREWVKEHKRGLVIVGALAGVMTIAGLAAAALKLAIKGLALVAQGLNGAYRLMIILKAGAFKHPALAIAAMGATALLVGREIKKVMDEENERVAGLGLGKDGKDGKDLGPGMKKLLAAGGRGGRLEGVPPPPPLMLYAYAHGTFSAPLAQQLGYSENVAQRQVDIAQGIKNEAEGIHAEVKQITGNLQGLVNALQVR